MAFCEVLMTSRCDWITQLWVRCSLQLNLGMEAEWEAQSDKGTQRTRGSEGKFRNARAVEFPQQWAESWRSIEGPVAQLFVSPLCPLVTITSCSQVSPGLCPLAKVQEDEGGGRCWVSPSRVIVLSRVLGRTLFCGCLSGRRYSTTHEDRKKGNCNREQTDPENLVSNPLSHIPSFLWIWAQADKEVSSAVP